MQQRRRGRGGAFANSGADSGDGSINTKAWGRQSPIIVHTYAQAAHRLAQGQAVALGGAGVVLAQPGGGEGGVLPSGAGAGVAGDAPGGFPRHIGCQGGVAAELDVAAGGTGQDAVGGCG